MSEPKPAARRTSAEVEQLIAALRRAVARACPPDLASTREDLVQTALVRVLEMEGRGEQNRVRTTSYLWRVAYSEVADELRRLRRRPTVSLEEPIGGAQEGEEGSLGGALQAPAGSPALALALRGCLGTLVEQRRAAVVLHLHGFSAEESAQALGRTVKQVQNAAFRGFADLRCCLEAKGHAWKGGPR